MRNFTYNNIPNLQQVTVVDDTKNIIDCVYENILTMSGYINVETMEITLIITVRLINMWQR